MKEYDLLIVGAGFGGFLAGETAALYGLKTAIIERKYLGGVCLNAGCMPTKALVKCAKVMNYAKHSNEFGVTIKGKVIPDWTLMQSRMNRIVDMISKGIEHSLSSKGIDIIKGSARVISKNEVLVNKKKYKAKNIIIATGASPVMLPLEGFKKAFDDGKLLTSDEALKLKELPKSIIIVGGGFIGVEFAALFAELGCKVTIIEGMPTILEMLDSDVSKEMSEILANKGIKIIVNAFVKKIDNDYLFYEINGKLEKIKGDKILLSVGRRPNLDSTIGLDLKMTSRKQYEINQHMQTSIPSIYAIGDCSSPLMLAHAAARQGDIVIAHIKGFKRGSFDLMKTPWCLYLNPEAAGVGLTEEEIKKQGMDYLKAQHLMQQSGKPLLDGDEAYGFVKILIDKKDGKILGCHIVGPNASDMITEIVAAMELKATIYDLVSVIHPHPSMSEIIYGVAKQLVYELDKAKGFTK